MLRWTAPEVKCISLPFNFLFNRLETHFAENDEEGRGEEEEHIRNVLLANGYSNRFTNGFFYDEATGGKAGRKNYQGYGYERTTVGNGSLRQGAE